MNGRLGARAGAVLDAALDRLIPGDEFGPGVARSVQGMLARTDAALSRGWRSALVELDDLALARVGAAFVELGPDAQDELLELVAAGATPASESTAAFVEMLRVHAIEGYFGDPRWRGNAGRAGWAMLGHEGPRLIWSRADRELESLLAGG